MDGDGKGGWTDQGENSVPEMPTGRRVFEGIPFDIAAKAGQQVIVLRGQSREAFPTRAEVKVDKRGKALYFLHAAAWDGDLDRIRALLAAGADPTIRDSDGRAAR